MAKDGHLGLRVVVTVILVLLAVLHLAYPKIEVDAFTGTALIAAAVLWLTPLVKSIEFPGGAKLEFPEVQKTEQDAEAAGLLASDAPPLSEHTQALLVQDPNLALASLRIEIETTLREQASRFDPKVPVRSIWQITRILVKNNCLTEEQARVIMELSALLNSAVHGARVDPWVAEWALTLGSKILAELRQTWSR